MTRRYAAALACYSGTMLACRSLPLLLLAMACSRTSSSPPPTVLAGGTLGPAGGVLEVMDGKQAGLRLTVPPGALLDPVEVRVVDVEVVLPAGLLATSYAPDPAAPFRLEPVGLYLERPATLRLPYDPTRILGTGRGNVRVRQQRSDATVDHEPPLVDVVAGRVEITTQTFGRFQVVRGPRTTSIVAYQPPLDAVVPLADGWSFVATAVPATSPFAAAEAVQWQLTGPAFEERWMFDGLLLRGRELPPLWRETWDQPVAIWQDTESVVPQATTTTMQVNVPIAVPGLGGSMTVLGAQSWDAPRPLGDRLAYDVVRLQVNLAWNRHDIGTGQREYVFWFAPEVGLLALGIDGVVHARTSP